MEQLRDPCKDSAHLAGHYLIGGSWAAEAEMGRREEKKTICSRKKGLVWQNPDWIVMFILGPGREFYR